MIIEPEKSDIIIAISVIAGFSALILSGFSSIRFFGYLVLISLGSCLAGAIILIPTILMKYKPHFAVEEMGRRRWKKV